MSEAESRRIFQRRLNQLLEENNMDQQELAAALGVSTSAVSNWASGINIPRMDKIERIAELFSVSRSSLIEAMPAAAPIPPGFSPMPELVSVPMVGRIACGEPITAEENLEGYVSVPSAWHATFSLLCRGDSMNPTYQDGDIVAIHSQPAVENGEVAAVRIDSEATLKHVYLHDGCLELRPENPSYQSIILIGEDIKRASIEGKAVGICRGV